MSCVKSLPANDRQLAIYRRAKQNSRIHLRAMPSFHPSRVLQHRTSRSSSLPSVMGHGWVSHPPMHRAKRIPPDTPW
jgi:hypothetical protein